MEWKCSECRNIKEDDVKTKPFHLLTPVERKLRLAHILKNFQEEYKRNIPYYEGKNSSRKR